MTIWFTADTHFSHGAILNYCGRPFETKQEHDETLIKNWNSVVKPGDTVYHLGDFGFGDEEYLAKIGSRLRGKIGLILGNHDKRVHKEPLRSRFMFVKDVHMISSHGMRVFLSHYAHRTWMMSNHGSIMLFGHCVDTQTEILTCNGWKKWNEIIIGEPVWSYNDSSKTVEQDSVKDLIVYPHYGEVYSLITPKFNVRLTPNHTMIYFSGRQTKDRRMYEADAREFFTRAQATIMKSGYKDQTQKLDLCDDLLRLYIIMAADSNIKKATSLVRVKVFKNRKIEYVQALLEKLGIPFTVKNHVDGGVSTDFYLPEALRSWNVKGLDRRLLACNHKQCAVIIEAYRNSDGCAAGNSTIIYSAKEQEIDLLQELFVVNGFLAKKYSRISKSSFSKKEQYQLCVTPKTFALATTLNSRHRVEQVSGETFWCIKNTNQNFFMRREGVVMLTGNSHGNMEPYGLSCDVGVDCWNFTPVNILTIKELMEKRKLELDYNPKEPKGKWSGIEALKA